MEVPRFRFTCRRLILSLGWLAVAAALFFDSMRSNPGLGAFGLYGAIVAFGAGTGQIFGRPIIGAVIAVLMFIATICYLILTFDDS